MVVTLDTNIARLNTELSSNALQLANVSELTSNVKLFNLVWLSSVVNFPTWVVSQKLFVLEHVLTAVINVIQQ